MKDLEKLSAMLAEIDDLLTNCMKCGMCQSVCPVFTETQRESDVTRGKIYMLEALAKNMISDAKGVKTRLEKCLLCGTCAANCPSGVSAVEIFILARSILTEFIGLSAVKKAIFRGLISHPRLFNTIVDLSKKFQGFVIKPTNPELGTYCSAALSSYIGNRHFMPLADKPFHARKRKQAAAKDEKGDRILFFPGCVVDKIYPGIAESSLNVLEQNGAKVDVPKIQTCCGIPALASGDTKTFATLFKQNLNMFRQNDYDYLLTPCATCTSTIKKIWPMIARDLKYEWQFEADELATKTMDISEYLVDIMQISPPDLPYENERRITYHDPCHLGKSLNVTKQPRQLLSMRQDVQLVEMKDANICCGNGGSFNLQHYETSTAIGEKKCENIVETGAVIVATSCPACMMQLTDMLSQKRHPVEVKHVIEVFDGK